MCMSWEGSPIFCTVCERLTKTTAVQPSLFLSLYAGSLRFLVHVCLLVCFDSYASVTHLMHTNLEGFSVGVEARCAI